MWEFPGESDALVVLLLVFPSRTSWRRSSVSGISLDRIRCKSWMPGRSSRFPFVMENKNDSECHTNRLQTEQE